MIHYTTIDEKYFKKYKNIYFLLALICKIYETTEFFFTDLVRPQITLFMMIIVIPEDIMNLVMVMIVEVTVPAVPEVVKTVLEVVAGKY